MNITPFDNPRKLPIDEVYLRLDSRNSTSNGVVITVKAIDKHWVTNRMLSRYEPPPIKSNVLTLQAWKDKMSWYIEDLKWLLSLKYHIFWSHIVHYKDCMDTLVSFLQEANPPYCPVYDDPTVLQIYNTIYHQVMHTFTRLIQIRESEIEWMKESYLACILYDKFIFSIPIIFDLCLLYGPANPQKVSSLINTVFQLQPNYLKDLQSAINFIRQRFKYVTFQVNPSACPNEDGTSLPDTLGTCPKSLKDAVGKNLMEKLPLATSLSDLILFLLDISLTVKSFLECYPDSVSLFWDLEFHLSIVQLYENAIPDLYKKLEESEDCNEESENIKQIDFIRMELIDTVRLMLGPCIEKILIDEKKEKYVSMYLTMVMDCLSEKAFIVDYQMYHPVDADLDVISQVYPDIDPVKSNYILQAVYSNLEDTDLQENENENVTKQTETLYSQTSSDILENVDQNSSGNIPEDVRMESLISEVKEIMPHLGEGYILKCLEFYGFVSESVISSILEGTLDESLMRLDEGMPLIPVDPLDKQFIETGIDRLNIFDNDEFDVMTRDNIDPDKVHRGKRKSKFKNANELLNDKSDIKGLSDIYSRFSMVSDETNAYDDEYDDTYDSAGEASRGKIMLAASEESEYTQRRPFQIPRVLRVRDESEDEEEESDEEPIPQPPQSSRNAFCVNPEEIRAKREAQRNATNARAAGSVGARNNQSQRNTDVVGKAKGQGQDKEVTANRDKKNVHKSSRANHNRRAGAQWKRSQGFIPS